MQTYAFPRVILSIVLAVVVSAAGADELRVGAINWDCSRPSTTFFGGFATRSLGPRQFRDRTPYYAKVVGEDRIEYADRTLAEYETELRYAIDAGIDYFAYCWYDAQPATNHVRSGAAVAAADPHLHELTRARRLHLQSPLRDRIGLCAILVACGPYTDGALEELADAMRDPCYEKVGGRPLLYIFERPWEEVLKRLCAICRARGAGDPYAVRIFNGAPSGDSPGIDAYGAYACTERSATWEGLQSASLRNNAARAAAGKPIVPHWTVGWDPTPRVLHPVPWCGYPKTTFHPPATEEQLVFAARGMRAWMDANAAACPTGKMLVFAWNEFEEGGWICPTLGRDGSPDFTRRDAFAAAVRILKGTHRFEGGWITDAEMSAQTPRPVKARQLQRDKLPPVNEELRNRHILFRKSFDLGEVKDARVFVTADDYYKLYVNGAFVGQGPAAGTPEHTWYNEIDVTGFLRRGRNVIAVHTYYQGLVNRVWVSGDNRHGLLLDLVADGRTVVKSDASFLTARHGAYASCGIVGYDTQFLERYDAAAREVGFERPGFDDRGWSSATVHPRGGDYRTFPQPTPMLTFEEIRPSGCETAADGTLRFDFGGIYVGSVAFAAKGPKGAEVLILCGQELNADGSARHKMRCNCDYVERFVLSGGARDELIQFDYKSFRYLELKAPPGVTIDRESVRLVARHLPFALKAKPNFGCDPDLARIWALGVDTFRYGVQEQIQDCMDREKGYYLGDGCYTMYAYCLLTGDWTPARKFFDDFLRTRDIDRGLVTCANCSFMQEIAEYPLMLILFARIYLEETGDVEFIRARYAAFADILDSYRERYARADGLLANLDKWCVVEWPRNFQDGYDADVREGRVCTDVHNVVNAWYVGAVKCLNAIAARIGREPYADAAPFENAFRRVFWDGERRLFLDREGSRHVSLPGNSYAALFGLEPQAEEAAFRREYLKLVREKGYSSISMFQFVPVFAYLKAKGETALLHELIASPDAWLRILREGGTRTFEGWGRDTKWNTSLFHLTAASVVIFLCDSSVERAVSK